MSFLANKQARGRVSSAKVPNFRRQIFLGFFWLVIVILIITAIWYVTRLSFLSIHIIDVSGGETISHEEVRAHLQDELNGTYYLIIPKRFSYLYPHGRMMEVLEENSRLYNVHVERESLTTLRVSFEEYVPHALWCVKKELNLPCYFLTKNGFAFAPAPLLIGGTLVRHENQSASEIHKETVIETNQLEEIDSFIKRSESELGFRITSLVYTKDGDIQFMINGGGMIMIAKGKDFNETFENVKTVLASKEFSHVTAGNFNYIDARFGNKIYVHEEMQSGSSTTTEAISDPS